MHVVQASRRLSARTAVAALVLLTAATTAYAGPQAAAEPADGRISGTVTNSDGEPLAGIEVGAYRGSGDSWTSVPQAFTDADGRYELDGLAGGAYRVSFDDHEYGLLRTGYVTEYWDDSPFFDGATSISVDPGQQVGGVDAELATGSHITGTVTGGGDPLRYVSAVAYVWNGKDWQYETTAETNSLGRFDLGGLARGTYRVGFELYYSGYAYLPEYWSDASTLEDATNITVAPETVVAGVDADLPEGGRVTGTVTGPSGEPLPGIDVEASRRVAGAWKYLTEVRTDAEGHYELMGLPTDDYVLRFDDWQEHYVREYWDDSATLEGATSFHVTAGETVSDKDAGLAQSPPLPFDLVQRPAVSGQPRAGDPLSAQLWQWNPEPTFSYRWLVDGVAVPGAVDADFTPRTEDVGKMVQVELTGALDGFVTRTVLSDAVGPVAAVPAAITSPPTTSRTPRVGRAVVVSPGVWAPSDVHITYRWLRDGTPIPGATGQTYTPTPADLGRSLQVSVTASRPGATATTTTTVSAIVQRGTIAGRTPARLRGRAALGARLHLDTGTWLPGASTTRIQWYADGKPIAGANSTSLRLTRALARKSRGTKISVRLTISAAGYDPITRSLTAPGKVRRPQHHR